jgi:electron-transferring-flavoprotein dehydrogenase
MDLYNIFGGANDVDDLVAVVTALPGQQLVDAMGKGTSSMSLGLKLKTLLKTFGHWDLLYELYRVHERATDLKARYDAYPSGPDAFSAWRTDRDSIMDAVYEITGAEPKY